MIESEDIYFFQQYRYDKLDKDYKKVVMQLTDSLCVGKNIIICIIGRNLSSILLYKHLYFLYHTTQSKYASNYFRFRL